MTKTYVEFPLIGILNNQIRNHYVGSIQPFKTRLTQFKSVLRRLKTTGNSDEVRQYAPFLDTIIKAMPRPAKGY